MEKIVKPCRRALAVSTTVLISGIAASLAGNLQAINLGDAQPGIGGYISATLWPLFLFGAIEVMLHTPWIKSWRDALTKWAGLGGVAMVALWVSYWHLAHVLTAYGYDTVSSHAGPLAIDLTMAMATMALNRVGQARRGPVATVSTLDGLLAEWEAEMDEPMATQPEPGVDEVAPISPAPSLARSNEVKPESVPEAARTAFKVWTATEPADRPTAGDMYALVGGEHKVSPRTARRWYYAAKATL